MRRGLRTSLSVFLFLSMVAPAWAGIAKEPPTAFFFRLTLDGIEMGAVTAFEVAEEPSPLGPRLTVKTVVHEGMDTPQVGQSFGVAILQIFDQHGSALASYRLSSARVSALRDAGQVTGVTREIVLSGKRLSVSFP